ncbi:Type II secretion system protein D precursor [Roseimaritima multifibrata]|uniref:Type II secretion system protein D n=2 Tax=Roseimaritima multifibrata TaxID=1930274 RepID=A0A517MB50_9BACT|nr:pilus assembly protein N-terminal domain-containing protein [Roseimaritima multifibrata]QDS92112.1 Type II secretion system protein D precursor [Roseimaritima multifibrata]
MIKKRFAAHAVACLLLVAGTTGSPQSGHAQGLSAESGRAGDSMLASTSASVNYNVTQPVERLEMIVKSSRILTLDKRVPRFQVHNEQILGATPVSQNQIQVHGKTPGTTQLNLWDADDQLYTVDIVVLADAREVEGILGSQLPMASLRVTPINQSAIVSGTVTNVDDVDRAVAIVEQYYPNVVNNIRVVGVQQVLLHTKIMEVSRTKLRDFGIDWGLHNPGGIDGVVSAPGGLVNAAASPTSGALSPVALQGNARAAFTLGSYNFEALIKALRQNDLIKVLAEPTVVATHGRPARFIVGGKVPYLIPSQQGVTVNYEEFGTSVDFLPFVVGPGRIRLEVRPEVSEPDPSRGLTIDGTSVPGFRSRYVETAVEMDAGQTFAIAGLLQSRTEASTSAIPFLGELPYFGAAFRRVTETTNEIELLILVTPEFVGAMDPHEVPRGGPGLNSMSPTDNELYLKGHIEVPVYRGGCGNCGQCTECTSAGLYSDGIPADAVIPQAEGTEVAPGVTVLAPAE